MHHILPSSREGVRRRRLGTYLDYVLQSRPQINVWKHQLCINNGVPDSFLFFFVVPPARLMAVRFQCSSKLSVVVGFNPSPSCLRIILILQMIVVAVKMEWLQLRNGHVVKSLEW